MAFDLSFFVILFGGVLVLLLVLGTWVLWKPLLALVPAPPDAVRRDLAYRIRGIGYPVEVVKDVLRVRVDSLAQIKLHVRRGARGTQIRYEVDATNLGWSIVLVTALITYLAVIAVGVGIAIHARARAFARSRVVPLLGNPPLGTLPPMDVQSLILEGLSEAQRLSQEALDYEREARQNAVGIVLFVGLIVWVVVFLCFVLASRCSSGRPHAHPCGERSGPPGGSGMTRSPAWPCSSSATAQSSFLSSRSSAPVSRGSGEHSSRPWARPSRPGRYGSYGIGSATSRVKTTGTGGAGNSAGRRSRRSCGESSRGDVWPRWSAPTSTSSRGSSTDSGRQTVRCFGRTFRSDRT